MRGKKPSKFKGE
jgi:hypothetical protein